MWHLCLKQRDDRDDGRGDRADDGSGRAVALLRRRRRRVDGVKVGAGRYQWWPGMWSSGISYEYE